MTPRTFARSASLPAACLALLWCAEASNISLRSLCSKDLANLMMAGRIASFRDVAFTRPA